jgi:hypothetical protein
MKIYFKNKAARLRFSSSTATCKRCPFYVCTPCPFEGSTIVDCDGKGWWVDGESLDIFKV